MLIDIIQYICYNNPMRRIDEDIVFKYESLQNYVKDLQAAGFEVPADPLELSKLTLEEFADLPRTTWGRVKGNKQGIDFAEPVYKSPPGRKSGSKDSYQRVVGVRNYSGSHMYPKVRARGSGLSRGSITPSRWLQEHADVIRLRFLEGLTYEAIAEVHGVTKQRIFSIIKKFIDFAKTL